MSAGDPLGGSGVTRTYFMLQVQDMARALAFYRSVLGEVIRVEGPQWSELKFGESTVALHAGGGAPRETGFVVEVADLDAACAAVVAAGGRVAADPMLLPDGARIADVHDTEGNGFSLSSTSGVTAF
ncbi:MAG: VOC family protein [Acidimicrobiales bacterium]|nr:hypothetical protein [Acidimicrobiales bacterium]MCB1248485.1 hypothetical protein [Acidimicrobiales bacterium]MCB1260759.1 hypothetical protein [Acidimicrobiales bacterium]